LQGGGASISYGALEHSLSTFEILVGDQRYAKCVDVPGGAILDFPPSSDDGKLPSSAAAPENADGTSASGSEAKSFSDPITDPGSNLPQPALSASFTPIEGGREASGEPLFVVQAEFERGWYPGKAGIRADHCCIAYIGGELWVKEFRVLGYTV
jgi:hypothetical protein